MISMLKLALFFASFIVLELAFTDAAFAQSTLSWEQVVSEAEQSNPELLAARHNLSAADYQQKVARSGYFPQVSAGARAARGDSGSLSSGTNSIGSTTGSDTSSVSSGSSTRAPSNSYSQSLSLTQNIFSGFDTTERVRQAAANRDVAKATLDIATAKASYDLKSAFAALTYSQRYLKLAADIIKRREENLRIVELRYQSGSENKGSYLLSGASLSEAKFDHLQASNAIEVSRQQLAKVIGLSDSTGLNVVGKVPSSEPEVTPNFIKLAELTPEDRQALAQRRAAEAATEIARAPIYPTIDASSDLIRQEQSDGPDRDRWQVGLGLSIPLFTGGKNFYGVKAAAETAAAANSTRVSVYTQEIVKLRQTYTSFVEAVAQFKVAQEFVEAASVRAEIARSKYNNGLLTFEDWDIIENDLISRQKAALQSERDRVIAQAAWEQAQGNGVLK